MLFRTQTIRSNSSRVLNLNKNKLFGLSQSSNGTKRSIYTVISNNSGIINNYNNTDSNVKRCKINNKMFNNYNQIRFNAITSNTDGSIIPDDVSKLTDEEYHKYSDITFEQILEELDAFFEENKIMEAEIDEEAGVMEINCSEGTYIINKQPPTKQIWLSSPISGPKRFDYHDKSWTCLRNGEKLSDLLQNEMSQMYGDFKWSEPF
ncbi:Mitochondrial chaperone Frataxin [Pichia californica]|uniref:ferroxidase n=1 Tax=Pichia californica TaxID=460514 RepID=A0A9P6WJ37_9ASCO|nr:Mitochondrial chaperone Frataxin [[Candida] californica]KAG0686998.1 Mitochondrial chaperone Frataxin [[Candida] californica]